MVHYILPSAASTLLSCNYQCLIIHTKLQLNRCINLNVSLPHWFERNGVFERKALGSSRCLAYLNRRPPPTATHTHTPPPGPFLPIPETSCGLEQELCVCFYSSPHKVRRLKECRQGYQRVQGNPPHPPPNGITLGGELVTDPPTPPIHGFIQLQRAARSFHLCFWSCLTGRKAAIVSSFLLFVRVRALVCVVVGVSLRLYVPHCNQE